MNQNQNDASGFNRRDFLKSGSLATMMAMLGGVELLAQTNATPPGQTQPGGVKTKVALIGCGPWGREILNTLARLPIADVAAVCDSYPAFLRRSATLAPGAKTIEDYKTVLADKDIKAVIVATPTHQHKEVVLAALKAGKHVYCEAPLATTIEEAREIALAAKNSPLCVFQPGLQMRADPQRHFLLPFIRSGAIGQFVMARAQWHKKQSWRLTAPTPEREKAVNWRLDKDLSLGLLGELGIHQVDEVNWFSAKVPSAVRGYGRVAFWKDGREVPDTVQAIFEYPEGFFLNYDATLANSFDADYQVLYGSDAAVMMRESKAWLFKEVDSPLLGWEIYAKKDIFYKETGIALVAGASKSVDQASAPPVEQPYTNTPLSYSLGNFLRNAADITGAIEDFKASFGEDDIAALTDHVSKVRRQPAAGYLEGYQSAVSAIKAVEAIRTGQRVEIPAELYELA